MMTLDLAVARAVSRACLAERALHAPDGWTVRIGDLVVPANRTVLADQITFSAAFPRVPNDSQMVLEHESVPLSVRAFTPPDFVPFIVDWEVLVTEMLPVTAA